MLNFSSPINNLSYGIVGYNILNELVKQGKEPALFPIGQVGLERQDQVAVVQVAINRQDSYDVNAPCIRLYHQFALAEFVGKGKHIGWPIFELDKFSKRELHHLNSCDDLIVCSKWAADIIKDQTGKSAHVVPLGVDRTIFFPASNKDEDNFVFLVVGKIEIRKAHDLIPTLFKCAFEGNNKVHLRMLWGNPFLKPEEIKEWEDFYKGELGDQVSFVNRLPSQADIANEMRAAHAGLCLSKAEGWDLPALEMLSCGLPIVATNVAAHMEFLTNKNANLIDCPFVESAFDGKWFFNQGNWASLGADECDAIVSAMRGVYNQWGTEYNSEGVATAEQFSWENSAIKLMGVL